MRKTAAALCAVLALSGCAGRADEEQMWSRSNMIQPSSKWDGNSDAQAYLNLVATNHPDLIDYFGEKWIVEFGYNTCASIEEGVTWQEMLSWDSLLNTEMPEVTQFLIAGAVVVFCPDYEQQFLG